MSRYTWGVEVAADFGMFTRPDSGFDSVSFPIPPTSAARGLVDSIVRTPGVKTVVAGVSVCNRPEWYRYEFNSRTHSRKATLRVGGNAQQHRWHVLRNCRFQIFGWHEWEEGKENSLSINLPHQARDELLRKVKQGRARRHPCMGITDFPLTFYGLPSSPVVSMKATIPAFAYIEYVNNKPVFKYKEQKVENGLAVFEDDSLVVENNHVKFSNTFRHRGHRWMAA